MSYTGKNSCECHVCDKGYKHITVRYYSVTLEQGVNYSELDQAASPGFRTYGDNTEIVRVYCNNCGILYHPESV
jgi:hypothetical protein